MASSPCKIINLIIVLVISVVFNNYLLFVHRRQVPDITDNGPGCHHHVDVGQHAVLGAVPEGFSKLDVIFDGDRPNGSTNLKGALLELHDAGVVDASPLGKYQDG